MIYILRQLDYLKKSVQEDKGNSDEDGRISFEPAGGKVLFLQYNPCFILHNYSLWYTYVACTSLIYFKLRSMFCF